VPLGVTMYLMNTTTAPFTRAIGLIVGTVSVGFVVTQLDVTIVNIALAKICSGSSTLTRWLSRS
jgi:DHA2 family methylenomycin A resistance protein-like MFS transporter